MRRVLSLEGRRHRVEARAEPSDACLRIEVEGAEGALLARAAPGGWTITQGTRTIEAGITRERSGAVVVEIEGHRYGLHPDHEFRGASGTGRPRAEGSAAGAVVRTPMPGKVVRLLREEGDRVAAGDAVLVFEAMKMQNEIRAPASGVIANMRAAAGTPLEGGEILFAVKPADSP